MSKAKSRRAPRPQVKQGAAPNTIVPTVNHPRQEQHKFDDTAIPLESGPIAPKVSVITIFFDAQDYLPAAIESVLAQSYSNWELLLVDDGSHDSSTTIAREAAASHAERIFYLSHPDHANRGMSATRNLGIAHARGEYVAMLDADDIWMPSKLEEQVALLDKHPQAAAVYGRRLYWHTWKRSDEQYSHDQASEHAFQANTIVEPPALLTMLFGFLEADSPGIDIMVRRETALRLGAFDEEFKGLFEDNIFLVKLLSSEPVYVSSKCWTYYRQHASSCVNRTITSPREFDEHKKLFLIWAETYLREHGMHKSLAAAAIHDQLIHFRHPLSSAVTEMIKSSARRLLPVCARRAIRKVWQPRGYTPPVGWVRFGGLRRLTPISRDRRDGRVLPIDQYYAADFFGRYANMITGRVLEIGTDYEHAVDGYERVHLHDLLRAEHTETTADLLELAACSPRLDAAPIDCMILDRCLQSAFDVAGALRWLYRALKPGGICLATLPGICRRLPRHDDNTVDYWRFTASSAEKLFQDVFAPGSTLVGTHGNVLTSIAILHGLAAEELTHEELDHVDPAYEVVITVVATKALADVADD